MHSDFFSDICREADIGCALIQIALMKPVETFDDIMRMASGRPALAKIAVVNPVDEGSIHAVELALQRGIARFVLFGDSTLGTKLPQSLINSPHVELVETEGADSDAIARAAVKAVRDGQADVLMKGLVNTDNYLRAVLSKQEGLLPAGNVLTHLSVAQIPAYHKLLFFSDVAVIPYPTIDQRRAIIRYDLATCRQLGIDTPKVALIHFTEKVNPKFPNSTDYVELEKEAARGDFGSVKMGGPIDVKTACDRHSAEVKGIESDVCGDADLLIFPNIESGNTFYKTITLFGGALIAGILQGAACPVILPSRSDSSESKLASIALACAVAH